MAGELDAALDGGGRDMARDAQAKLLDFAKYLAQDRRYFTDEVHLTVAGAKEQGTLFARYFDKHVLPPENGNR